MKILYEEAEFNSMIDRGIDRDFIFLVFELIVISSEPNCPKAMRDDGSQGGMPVEGFTINLSPQLAN